MASHEHKIDINYSYVAKNFPDAIKYLQKSFKYTDTYHIDVSDDELINAKFSLQWLELSQDKIFWYIETELYNKRQCWTPTLPSQSFPNEIKSLIL